MAKIINRTPELIAEKFGGEEKVVVAQVQREIGSLPYKTVFDWIHNPISRIDIKVLEVFCEYLNCDPGDILVRSQETGKDVRSVD